MKKAFFILLITGLVSAANAQNTRLNVYGGYVFDDHVDNGYSSSTSGYVNATVKGGFLWGGGLEFKLHDYYGLELLYQRLDTHAPIDYYPYYNTGINDGLKTGTADLGINYIMIGGTRSMQRPGSKAEPYGGFMLGMAIVDATFHPDDNGVNSEPPSSSSATKFAWGLRLGTNIWASDRVGIKLQMQLLSVPQGAGGGLYFGTGGAGAGITTYSTILQFGIGGGLTFKLGGSSKPHQ
jgi:opacity protein-like surface antigen